MRIILIDTVYPDFIRTLPFDASSSYEAQLQAVLSRSFGTADFYSRNLRALGWNAVDVIANHEPLRRMWTCTHGWAGRNATHQDIAMEQIFACRPDVVFMQDLSFFDAATLRMLADKYLLAGQLSCPWPGDDIVRRYSVLFTSFPHYVARIEALGVKAVFLPLAFESDLLGRLPVGLERIHDVVFIGGVGAPSHWPEGMKTLEAVAAAIPTFKWWGYGYDTLPSDSALRERYQGQAFGLAMYKILLQSKICLNRHGTVSAGYANNLRMYEATGCGAMLLTEASPNLHELFSWNEIATYDSPSDAVAAIHSKLDNWDALGKIVASNGQRRTLRDHTYAQRMKLVSETLTEMLCPA